MTFDPTKRETLHKMATSLLAISGLSQVGSLAMLNAKPHGWLALRGQTTAVSPTRQEETLDRFEQLIVPGWQLSRGKQQEMAAAKALAASCLPTLTAFACQPSPQQQRAANLAAQWYRLHTLLGYHTENVYVAGAHAQNAVTYSKIANNPDLIVASLAMHSLVLYYADRPEQALEKCTEAEQYLEKTTYAVQSYLYRRKAACLAQLRQDKQALDTWDLAQETYHLHPSSEIPLSYAEHNEIEMFLWEGITRSHIDQHNTAIATLERLNPRESVSVIPERIRTGFLNNLVFAELRKPAQKRDLERCITLWQEAAQSATSLQSELRYNEVIHAYVELAAAFPGETRLKELRYALSSLSRNRNN